MSVQSHVRHDLWEKTDRERRCAQGPLTNRPPAFPRHLRDGEIQRRSQQEEHVLLADHRHQCSRQSEEDHLSRRPGPPDVEPHGDEDRDGKRGAGVRHRWRDIHVEEQRCSNPYEECALQAGAGPTALVAFHHRMIGRGVEGGRDRHIQQDSSCRPNREQHGEKPVDGRSVRDGGKVRTRVAIDRHVVSGVPQPFAPSGLRRHRTGSRAARSRSFQSSDVARLPSDSPGRSRGSLPRAPRHDRRSIGTRSRTRGRDRTRAIGDTRSTRPRPKSRCAR